MSEESRFILENRLTNHDKPPSDPKSLHRKEKLGSALSYSRWQTDRTNSSPY